MVLSFKKEFKQAVLQGSKIHTLRLDPKRRWKQGMKIHFATGVRTSNYDNFMMGTCKKIQTVHLSYKGGFDIGIIVSGVELHTSISKNQFAANDGFTRFIDFFAWFHPLIEETENNCLELKLIHWTEFKY